MKISLKKITLFALLFCVVNIISNIFLKKIFPVYAFNDVYSLKYEYYLKNRSNYNTVFFGSSRTLRHINPEIIDNKLQDLGIKSFNLGAQATFNPEGLFLYEEFLKSESTNSNIRYAFVELSELEYIASVNLFSPRSYYYINFEYLRFILSYYISSNKYTTLQKIQTCYPFVQGYVLNTILPFFPHQKDAEAYYLGENNDGFLPLDLHLKYHQARDILERRAEFLRDTSVIKRGNVIRKKQRLHESTNSAYVDFLNQLILVSQKKHIELYFIIPPRLENKSLLAYLEKHISNNRVINLGSYEKYPDLYSEEYFFDSAHLNNLGATKYTAYLTNEFRRLVSTADTRLDQFQ